MTCHAFVAKVIFIIFHNKKICLIVDWIDMNNLDIDGLEHWHEGSCNLNAD